DGSGPTTPSTDAKPNSRAAPTTECERIMVQRGYRRIDGRVNLLRQVPASCRRDEQPTEHDMSPIISGECAFYMVSYVTPIYSFPSKDTDWRSGCFDPQAGKMSGGGVAGGLPRPTPARRLCCGSSSVA